MNIPSQIPSQLSTRLLKLINNKSLLFFVFTGITSTVFWLLGDSTLNALMYHRSGIASGEFWRVLSGHLVHSNGWHLLLNLASLLMVGLLFSQHLTRLFWLLIFTLSGLMISACYFWIAPEYEYYVGLSAVLYAVIIIGALLDIKEQPLIAVIVLVVVTARVIWQQYSGSIGSLAELIEDRVAIESHLFGICTGYILGIILLLKQHNSSKSSSKSFSKD
jgi:rhomboid family GlyGly-CTERM serine protease